MKKYIIAIASVLTLNTFSSCADDLLDLKPPYEDVIDDAIQSEEDVKRYLLGAYLKMSSGSLYGANLFYLGDLLGDTFFRSNDHFGGFNSLIMMNYDPSNTGEIDFYRSAYDVIQSSNMVIHNELENTPLNRQYKAEATVLRAMSYFNLVNYYASSPRSGQFQEYGVPIAAYPYNPDAKIARSSVAEVYNLIISDLQYAIDNSVEVPEKKYYLSKTAAKLLLSRVYITRQAPGDAQKALDLTSDIINFWASYDPGTGNPMPFRLATYAEYENYFRSASDAVSENHPETIWELDLKGVNNPGVNFALGTFYSNTGSKRSLHAKMTFFDQFKSTDVRSKLFTRSTNADNPKGMWIRKHERAANPGGNYTRNTKVLRFSEVYLNRIEALYQLGNTTEALNKLNEFAEMRQGNTYTGANLLEDILTERNREFFGEGQRFLDLKRYYLPLNRGTNCPNNCDLEASNRLFVFPLSVTQTIVNPVTVQHPLWQ